MGGIIGALNSEGFTVSLLELSHFEILTRPPFMIELNWDGKGAEKTKHVSSANNLGMQLTECNVHQEQKRPQSRTLGNPIVFGEWERVAAVDTDALFSF